MNPLVAYGLAGILVSLVLAGTHYKAYSSGEKHGEQVVKADWDKEKIERTESEKLAIITRIKNNERIEEQREIEKEQLKKGYKDEIDTLRRANASSPRLRINSNVCGGPAESPKAEGSNGNDAGTPSTRELSEGVDRDIKALVERYETAIAGCRVGQQWVIKEGMAP